MDLDAHSATTALPTLPVLDTTNNVAPSETITPPPESNTKQEADPQSNMLPLPFTVLIFGIRAANTTLDDYRNHYDNTHVPLAKSLAGPAWPLSHTRYYAGANDTLATISAPVDWDSMAVLTFRDDKHAFAFSSVLAAPGAAEKIHADEKLFMGEGSPKMVVVGGYSSVTRA